MSGGNLSAGIYAERAAARETLSGGGAYIGRCRPAAICILYVAAANLRDEERRSALWPAGAAEIGRPRAIYAIGAPGPGLHYSSRREPAHPLSSSALRLLSRGRAASRPDGRSRDDLDAAEGGGRLTRADSFAYNDVCGDVLTLSGWRTEALWV